MEKRMEYFAYLCNQRLNYKDKLEEKINEIRQNKVSKFMIEVKNDLLYINNLKTIIDNIESEIKKCYEVK